MNQFGYYGYVFMFRLFIVLIILPVVMTAGAKEDSRLKELDRFFDLCSKYYTFSGSVLIAEDNEVIYKRGVLYNNWKGKVRNGSETKFMIGSVSKPFTAMLVMKLVEEGKLKLSDTVSDYIEYYPSDKGGVITIHHLLCHTAGFKDISRYYKNFFSVIMKKRYTNRKYIKLFCDLDLEFKPGSKFKYSSAGYYLLAAIVEKVTGKPFGQVMDEKILKPAGMGNSGCSIFMSSVEGLAKGYDLYNYKYSIADFTDPTAHKGGGSLYSTVDDLYKFYVAFENCKVLKKSAYLKMLKPHASIRGDVAYGYGFATGRKFVKAAGSELEFFAHGGSYNGFASDFSVMKDRNRVIIILSNETGTDVRNIKEQIVNILYGKAFKFVIPLSFAFDNAGSVNGIKIVIEDYRKSPDRYMVKKDMLNGLGLTHLINRKLDEAVTVLEFAAEEFPESSMIFSSLGTVYVRAGRKKAAADSFRRCLEIKPGDVYALRQLKRLKQ